MARRDPKFREDILRLDGYRCQKCSYDGRPLEDRSFLEVDHVQGRGAGGIPSRDDRANGIALCKTCHAEKTTELWHIVHWDRNDPENGLVIKMRDGSIIPKEDLWFYTKQVVLMLEKIAARVQQHHQADADNGKDLWALRLNDSFKLIDPNAVSFEQYAVSNGWNAVAANEIADVYEWIFSRGLIWPLGLNKTKIKRLMLIDWRKGDDLQEWLDFAANVSQSEISKKLVEEGLLPIEAIEQIYVQAPLGQISFLRTSDPVLLPREEGKVVFRLDKVVRPLRRSKGKVYIEDGLIEEELSVIDMFREGESNEEI